MAAIDLLFAVKPTSERLHLLVLGALLQRTALLARLLPDVATLAGPAAATKAAPPELHFEPEGKLYDLALLGPADDPRAATAGRGRVLIELLLDSPLRPDKLAQQLNPGRFHDRDRLLYLLLGHSAITSDRRALQQRAARIAELSGRPDLVDRISLRDADDLIPLLGEPLLGPASADHHDARDLTAAYRDALLQLRQRSERFAERPLADWDDADFYGFFASARRRRIAGLHTAQIGRLATSDGSGVGCSFAEVALPAGAGQLELGFVGSRLTLRLLATADRKGLQKRLLDRLGQLVPLAPSDGEPPTSGWQQSPLRLAAVMTLAQRDGLLAGFPHHFDWQQFSGEVVAAEAILRQLAAPA
jgi:hypothetical protein